eukprot:1177663-Prorocentrum_minimum.AAC.1
MEPPAGGERAHLKSSRRHGRLGAVAQPQAYNRRRSRSAEQSSGIFRTVERYCLPTVKRYTPNSRA